MDEEMRAHIEHEIEEEDRERNDSRRGAPRSAIVDFGGLEEIKEDARERVEGAPSRTSRGTSVSRCAFSGGTPASRRPAVLTFRARHRRDDGDLQRGRGRAAAALPTRRRNGSSRCGSGTSRAARTRTSSRSRNFEAWKERCRSFSAMAGLVPAPVTLTDAVHPDHVAVVAVSPGILPASRRRARARPRVRGERGGRRRCEGRRPRRWILEAALPRRSLRHRRSIPIDGAPYTIVGVMPADFDPPRYGWIDTQELWLPFAATESNRAWGPLPARRRAAEAGSLRPRSERGDGGRRRPALRAR